MINTHEKLMDEMATMGTDAYCCLQQIARYTSVGKVTKYLRNWKLAKLVGISQRKVTAATTKLEDLGYVQKLQVFVTMDNQKYFPGKKIGSFAGISYRITTKYLSKFVNLDEAETEVFTDSENEKEDLDQEVDASRFDDIVNDDSVTDASVKPTNNCIESFKVLKVKSIESDKTHTPAFSDWRQEAVAKLEELTGQPFSNLELIISLLEKFESLIEFNPFFEFLRDVKKPATIGFANKFQKEDFVEDCLSHYLNRKSKTESQAQSTVPTQATEHDDLVAEKQAAEDEKERIRQRDQAIIEANRKAENQANEDMVTDFIKNKKTEAETFAVNFINTNILAKSHKAKFATRKAEDGSTFIDQMLFAKFGTPEALLLGAFKSFLATKIAKPINVSISEQETSNLYEV